MRLEDWLESYPLAYLSDAIDNALRRAPKTIGGRNHPVVIRPFEVIVPPNIRTNFGWISYLTICLYTLYHNDIALSRLFQAYFDVARRYCYQGSWGMALELAEIYNLSSKSLKPNYSQDLIYDTISWQQFLSEHFSKDDIYGNIIPQGVKYWTISRIKNIYKVDRRPVRRAARKRGYNDHGSLQPLDSRARREANTVSDDQVKRLERYDLTNHISVTDKRPLTYEEIAMIERMTNLQLGIVEKDSSVRYLPPHLKNRRRRLRSKLNRAYKKKDKDPDLIAKCEQRLLEVERQISEWWKAR
jgi:hypothetical protein